MDEETFLKKFDARIRKLARYMERWRLDDFVQYINSPLRLLYVNFLAGLARGLGMAIGFTVLGALFLYFLFIVAEWNLPIIGEFIARLVRIVQTHL